MHLVYEVFEMDKAFASPLSAMHSLCSYPWKPRGRCHPLPFAYFVSIQRTSINTPYRVPLSVLYNSQILANFVYY